MAGGKIFLSSRAQSSKSVPKKVTRADAHIKRLARVQASKVISRRSEHKYFAPSNWASTTSSSTPGIACISQIPQSTTSAQGDTIREGDEVYMTSFQFRMVIQVADTTNLVRFIIFQWKTDVSPTAGDILVNTSFPLISPYAKDTKNLYTIMYDRLFAVDTYNPQVVVQKYMTKGFTRKLYWEAGSSSVGSNLIYILNASDSGAVSHPAYLFYPRINFTDS